jgi:hypothetical protein
MAHIEAIESRTLFAVSVPEALIQLAEISTKPAVQSALNLVKADLTAINESRAGGAARAEFRQIVDTGLTQLATARDAVRAAREAADPATRDAAIATLKATRLELKTTLTSARANLRNSTIENRDELRAATASLRLHLKVLRFAVADNSAIARIPQPTPPQPTPTLTASTYRPSGSGGTLSLAGSSVITTNAYSGLLIAPGALSTGSPTMGNLAGAELLAKEAELLAKWEAMKSAE